MSNVEQFEKPRTIPSTDPEEQQGIQAAIRIKGPQTGEVKEVWPGRNRSDGLTLDNQKAS